MSFSFQAAASKKGNGGGDGYGPCIVSDPGDKLAEELLSVGGRDEGVDVGRWREEGEMPGETVLQDSCSIPEAGADGRERRGQHEHPTSSIVEVNASGGLVPTADPRRCHRPTPLQATAAPSSLASGTAAGAPGNGGRMKPSSTQPSAATAAATAAAAAATANVKHIRQMLQSIWTFGQRPPGLAYSAPSGGSSEDAALGTEGARGDCGEAILSVVDVVAEERTSPASLSFQVASPAADGGSGQSLPYPRQMQDSPFRVSYDSNLSLCPPMAEPRPSSPASRHPQTPSPQPPACSGSTVSTNPNELPEEMAEQVASPSRVHRPAPLGRGQMARLPSGALRVACPSSPQGQQGQQHQGAAAPGGGSGLRSHSEPSGWRGAEPGGSGRVGGAAGNSYSTALAFAEWAASVQHNPGSSVNDNVIQSGVGRNETATHGGGGGGRHEDIPLSAFVAMHCGWASTASTTPTAQRDGGCEDKDRGTQRQRTTVLSVGALSSSLHQDLSLDSDSQQLTAAAAIGMTRGGAKTLARAASTGAVPKV